MVSISRTIHITTSLPGMWNLIRHHDSTTHESNDRKVPQQIHRVGEQGTTFKTTQPPTTKVARCLTGETGDAMRYRRTLSDVRWAFRESVPENDYDVSRGDYKRLCDHCQVIDGPKCPRKRQLVQKRHQTMIATVCIFFTPLPS